MGLFTSIFLKELHPEADILILERGPYSVGASTRNAGFACFGSVSELLMDAEHMSPEEITAVIRMRWDGLNTMQHILGKAAIGYQECGGYELFSSDENELLDSCRSGFSLANQWASEATGQSSVYQWTSPPPGLKNSAAAIFNPYEASIDTGRMYASLLDTVRKKGIRILNGVQANAVRGSKKPLVKCDLFTIDCQKVFITTNAFARELFADLDVRPVRNQVLVTREMTHCPIRGIYHLDRGYFYFRNIGNRILIGGGRHLLGASEETGELGMTTAGKNLLESVLHQFIDTDESMDIEYAWSGILGVSAMKTPIIAQVDENVYAGVRMGGMGVAISSIVGKRLAALGLEM